MALCLLALLAALATPGGAWAGESPGTVGERIYRAGVLPGGAPLHGERPGSGGGDGAEIACVNCHRRSGLGSGEGTIRMPPITSRYLYSRSGVQAGRPALDARAASDASRTAYDDRSLAAAIRGGTGRGGRPLDYLMPRYALDDASMAALIAYLKTLPTTTSPGVSDTTIDLATIVAPDADPAARDGMLAVLDQFIADKNAFLRGGGKPLRSQGQIDYRVTRRWQLHVWRLTGTADTWEAQLREHLRAEPVFAVLSGIAGQDWSPVHRFCEAERLPCLFPNVAVPVDAEQDFYSIYLSKGALLEADLIATRLRDLPAATAPRRLVQVYATGDGAERAARRLGALAPTGFESLLRTFTTGDASGLAAAISAAQGGDTLVLWLRPGDLALLGATPNPGVKVFVSGELGGLEHAPLPAAWRSMAQLAYPVDLPEARVIRMTYPLRWFQIRHVPLLAEKVQADTYLACGIVAEALNDMLESFMRDFLVERIESMLSHRQLTAFYPRLGLAPGQRFASKGSYLVHFTTPTGTAIAADSEWVVP
jgi:hypothetical protein